MKHLFIAAAAAGVLSTAAMAHHDGDQFRSGELAVSHAYTFENAETAHAMRVYVTIENSGAEADRLIEASVPFADAVRFEGQVMDNAGSLVTNTLQSITINPDQSLTMQPGAVWIELESVHQTFEHGEHFDMTLTFENAGAVTIEVEVEDGEGHDPHDHEHEADS